MTRISQHVLRPLKRKGSCLCNSEGLDDAPLSVYFSTFYFFLVNFVYTPLKKQQQPAVNCLRGISGQLYHEESLYNTL
jgi:hypothetical protein